MSYILKYDNRVQAVSFSLVWTIKEVTWDHFHILSCINFLRSSTKNSRRAEWELSVFQRRSWMESRSTWLCMYSITLFSRTVWFSGLIGWGIRIHQKASEGSGFDYLSSSCISAYLAVFFERICKIKRLCFPSLAEDYKRGELLPYNTLRYSPTAF